MDKLLPILPALPLCLPAPVTQLTVGFLHLHLLIPHYCFWVNTLFSATSTIWGKKKKKLFTFFFSISQSFHILYFQSSNGKISLTVFLNTVFISSSTCFSILSWHYYVSQFSQLRYKNINKTPFPSKMWKKVLVLQRLRHMIKLIQSKCFHQFIWAMYSLMCSRNVTYLCYAVRKMKTLKHEHHLKVSI